MGPIAALICTKNQTAILNHLQQILFNLTQILMCEHKIFNSRAQLLMWGPHIYLATHLHEVATHYNKSSPTNLSQFHENFKV